MTLRPEHVAPDGDCLFHSILRCIKDVPFLSGVYTSAHQLRERVALAILSDPRAETFLRGWIELHQQAKQHKEIEMLMETMHVEHVYKDLTTADKYVAAMTMLDKQKYWGEEFALLTLEECLGVRFIVVDSHTNRTVSREHRKHDAKYVSVLLLSNLHYEPLIDKDTRRAAWPLDNLPQSLRNLQSSSES